MPRLAVIGLGYVGLPLAVALARHFPVLGFDIKKERVNELRSGIDRTGEVPPQALTTAPLELSTDPQALPGRDVYIITVPTPVDHTNKPDLGAVISACRTVGQALAPGAIVVLESTVYPGVTEGICGAELTAASGLVCGKDFFLGYSPERINPGDRQHTIDRITKVIAGQTSAVVDVLRRIYGAASNGNVFVARDIKTAEAAKVIENAQRDINIAFINEVTMIFNRLGMSIHDVLDASKTKWNFLPFTPGLVGGHCIGVDPFYLANLAQQLGHEPAVILSGRRINDGMGLYIADELSRVLAARGQKNGARILVLGLSFKEDVPDLRNSRVVDVVRRLQQRGHHVDIHDPLADAHEARTEYDIELVADLKRATAYNLVVGAVAHKLYREFTSASLSQLVSADGLVADVKGMWRQIELPAGVGRWQL